MKSPALKQIATRSRSQALREQVCELAQALGPGAKFPRVTDLCSQLKVSPTTLNGVLQELESEEFIVRRHAVGIFVGEKVLLKPARIALVCHPAFFRSSNHSPFWDLLLEHAKQRAASHNEIFEMHFSSPTLEDGESGQESASLLPESLAREVAEKKIDGVLGVGLSKATALLLESHVPFVAFAGWASHLVGLDTAQWMAMGVEALKNKGCRRIALWASVAPYRFQRGLEHGKASRQFRAALKKSGLPFDADLVRDNRELIPTGGGRTSVSQQEQGYRTVLEVFEKSQNPKPDGILIFDDMMTRGAISAFMKLGLLPGENVPIVTHANAGSDALLGNDENLFVLEYDPREFVEKMFGNLEMLMAGKPVPPVCNLAPHKREP